MKITRVEAIRAGQFCFARIECGDSLAGIGEAGCWGNLEAAEAAISKFADYLVGRDARAIEHHWNVLHRDAYYQGAAINAAISAIDIALWDIKGKALGVPVYELLGGPVRTSCRTYGHVYAQTLEAVVADCRAKAEAGFTAVGHLNPFLDEGEDVTYFQSHADKIDLAVARVQAFREAVGPHVDLCLELHRRLTPAEAECFARAVEPLRPMWLEDPIRPEPIDAMAQLRGRINVPIATGERYVSLYQFDQLIRRGGVDYVRPSIGLCGGITGARKIAALAEAAGIMVAPHNPFSPATLAAELMLDAAIPNFAIQEYPTGFDNLKMVSGETLLGADLFENVPQVRDGFIALPESPGIGVTLVDNPQEVRPPVTRAIGMRPHRDGFIVDQ
ncbi:MAG: mandelate racemase/muconate lactonizing enzyme family protein [Methyloligellaceae bacterium]